MVGWMGEPKGSPGSLMAGKTNSIQLTTSKIGLFGGDLQIHQRGCHHGNDPYPNSTPVYLAFLLLPVAPLPHRYRHQRI
ncbi:TPA: hypothetical protein SLO74_004506 [Citrobacter freundii]|uniref:hypothetical protein n=1 Tax=Citrobacter freundii TaxID=546 RepID=UPI0029072CE3|nr:hypothetical protein [Citrobacter freundii]HCB1565929.1 hypothetical protein [Citrobacter freundii]HEB2429505.1 hypothetical protein [Citrobacter freundii]HEJ0145184.1 hypothetical protein [Citrobacter freundii]